MNTKDFTVKKTGVVKHLYVNVSVNGTFFAIVEMQLSLLSAPTHPCTHITVCGYRYIHTHPHAHTHPCREGGCTTAATVVGV